MLDQPLPLHRFPLIDTRNPGEFRDLSVNVFGVHGFDLPLTNSPTSALPSSLKDAIPPPASCAGSLCPGSAAYLAKLSTTAAASLALSIDTAPTITLRNLGSVEATALQIAATGSDTNRTDAVSGSGGLISGTGTTATTTTTANTEGSIGQHRIARASMAGA